MTLDMDVLLKEIIKARDYASQMILKQGENLTDFMRGYWMGQKVVTDDIIDYITFPKSNPRITNAPPEPDGSVRASARTQASRTEKRRGEVELANAPKGDDQA